MGAVLLAHAATIADAHPVKPLELMHCIVDLAPKTFNWLDSMGMPGLPLFDGRYCDPEDDGILNADLLQKAITELIPNPKATGYGIIDWEGKAFETLALSRAGTSKFTAAMAQYQKALDLCKKLRPNIKWGIYFVPVTDYWLKDTISWQKINKKLLPLMKQCQVLFPSMYNHYPEGTQFTHNDYYIRYNVRQALKLGIQLKKPVIAFVWHRIHDGNTKNGLELIPEKTFYNTLKKIVDTRVGKKRIDGLMWFTADSYFLGIAPQLMAKENVANKEMIVYYDEIIERYFKPFLDIKKYYKSLK